MWPKSAIRRIIPRIGSGSQVHRIIKNRKNRRPDPDLVLPRSGFTDFQKFDRALKTQVRPVLVSLQRLPFRDFTAEEFLGRTLTTCRGAGGCVSVFQGSSLTLGQMADACVYVGGGADVDSKASGSILFRNVKIEPAEKGRSLNSRPTWL